MSRLDELIAELCPDGVEYRTLGEVLVSLKTGLNPRQNFVLNTEDAQNYYVTVRELAGLSVQFSEKTDRINDDALTRINGRSNLEQNDILFSGTGTIGRTAIVTSAPWNWNVKEGVYVLKPRMDLLEPFFLLYMLSATFIQRRYRDNIVGSPVVSLPMSAFKSLLIPVPPLEIQREIVKILDNFTALAAALADELQARKKQYEYYRDLLLSYDEDGNPRMADGQKAVWMTLGEVCSKVSSGGTPLATNPSYYNGDIPWLRTQEVDWVDITDTGVKITEIGMTNSSAKWIPANCVIVAMYGATAAKVAINKIPLTTNQACCNLEADPDYVHYRFMFHWLSMKYLELKSMGRGSQANINGEIVKSFPIPIPPLAEQERIVAILDRFDALVNDISSGLPAEIEARRKQYEYYRDQLLTFEEKHG